jgi:RNA polymerase sigma-54 factor
MALEQKLSPRLQQKLVMTPALQLAIKLLQLNKLELEQTLQQEMVENPMLEDREEPRMSLETEGEREADDSKDDQLIDNLDVDSFFEKYFDSAPTTANMREESEAPPIENTLTSSETLADHLLWQLEMNDLDDEEFEICQAVVGNLDDDGRLRASAAEIAEMAGWSEIEVEKAIGLIQTLDPIGVAARDLRECLFLQLEHLGIEGDLAGVMVRDHMDDVTRHRFKEIARATGATLEEVGAAMATIRELNPRPGQAYSDENPQYITPDVYVRKDGDEYVVSVNDDGLPRLRVSRMYRKLLRGQDGLGKEATDYLQEKMRSALWLIRSFGQRQRTIQKVSESIVKHQRAFLDHGVAALRPMVLRDVAEDIEMHESTVSRVVNGKYMHTPQGIFELKYFFHSGLGHASGSDVSSITVKERLRKLIEEENPRKPLSDAALARQLKQGGLQIARRTVAKYREELGIPASKLRREIV